MSAHISVNLKLEINRDLNDVMAIPIVDILL